MFGRKKGPENLSLNQESKLETTENKPEQKLTGAERVGNYRKATWEKISSAFKKTAEIGKRFIGGFDRVVGKGVENYDTAKAGVARGLRLFRAAWRELMILMFRIG